MFHRAVELKYLDGTAIEVLFQDGMVKQYDISVLFSKYPQLKALEDREIFLQGKLSAYGIIWNDDLDLETETIYEEGKTVRTEKPAANLLVAQAVAAARAQSGLSQTQLAALTGIDQSDPIRLYQRLNGLQRRSAAISRSVSNYPVRHKNRLLSRKNGNGICERTDYAIQSPTPSDFGCCCGNAGRMCSRRKQHVIHGRSCI